MGGDAPGHPRLDGQLRCEPISMRPPRGSADPEQGRMGPAQSSPWGRPSRHAQVDERIYTDSRHLRHVSNATLSQSNGYDRHSRQMLPGDYKRALDESVEHIIVLFFTCWAMAQTQRS